MEKKKKNYYAFERTDLLSLVPGDAKRILDVGCGAGVLGKSIKERNPGAEVVGVEIDKASCGLAAEVLDMVIPGNIETLALPFKENYFDCIVAGDVLEHLVDPWGAVKKLRSFLKEEGLLIASVPNIRYYKALIRLFRGYWDYTEVGILDRAHLRFFCLINIKELFCEAGLKIERIERNMVSARGFRILNRFFFNGLREFLTYQYYVIAGKGPEPAEQGQKRQVIQF